MQSHQCLSHAQWDSTHRPNGGAIAATPREAQNCYQRMKKSVRDGEKRAANHQKQLAAQKAAVAPTAAVPAAAAATHLAPPRKRDRSTVVVDLPTASVSSSSSGPPPAKRVKPDDEAPTPPPPPAAATAAAGPLLLAAGSIHRVHDQLETTLDEHIIVQVLEVRMIGSSATHATDRYRIVFSDGAHFIQGLLLTTLNHLVTQSGLQGGSIVQLQQYVVHAVGARKTPVLIVLDTEILQIQADRIGNPTAILVEGPAATEPPPVDPAAALVASQGSNNRLPTCPVCFEQYASEFESPAAAAASSSSQPRIHRVLGCLHSVCARCLGGMIEGSAHSRYIACPRCTRSHGLFDPTGVATNEQLVANIPTMRQHRLALQQAEFADLERLTAARSAAPR